MVRSRTICALRQAAAGAPSPRAAGTVETELLGVRSGNRGHDVSLPLIKGLGLRSLEHEHAARLLAARAWVAGRELAREDCPTLQQ